MLRSDTLVTLDNGLVAAWGNAINGSGEFLQSSPAQRPTLIEGPTGIQSIRYGAANRLMGATVEFTPETIVIIVSLDDLEGYARLVDRAVANDCGIHLLSEGIQGRFDDLPAQRVLFSAPQMGYTAISVSVSGDGSNSFGRAYGETFDLGDDRTWLAGNYELGRSSASFNGNVIEVSFFEDRLTEEQVFQFEQSRFDYYAPPLSLSPSDTLHLQDYCPFALTPDATYLEYLWSTGEISDTIEVSTEGWYILETLDLFGRVSMDSIYVDFPGEFIDSFDLCFELDSLWDTELTTSEFSLEWNDMTSDPSLLISTPGQYHVSITDSQGCTYHSDTITVTLDTFSTDATLGPDADLCVGNTLSLAGTNETIVDYLWSDGSVGEELEVEDSGTYYVTATDANNCIAHDTIAITILGEAPTADFILDGACQSEQVDFIDLSTPPAGNMITGHEWSFGEGEGSSVLSDPEYLYADTGQYTVSLAVTTEVGCRDSVAQSIQIHPKPMAHAAISLACTDSPTVFEDTSTVASGQIVSSQWQFAPGEDGAGAIAEYTYTETGSYDSRLVTVSDQGCRDTVFQSVDVLQSPHSDFDWTPVCLGEPMLFSADPDTMGSGPILAYQWDLGPGVAIFEEVTKVYNSAGEKSVTLTVTSVSGCSGDTTIIVTVYDDPIAGFTLGPACVGEPTVFSDASIVSLGDPITDQQWDFAGEGSSAAASPTHTFSATGDYDVLLQVTTATGCTDEVEQEVEVSEVPIADFDFDPIIGLPPLEVSFTDLSIDGTDYLWIFGDEGESQEAEPTFTFLTEGTQTITLSVANEAGCTDEASAEIFLTEPITDLRLDAVDLLMEGEYIRPVIVFGNLGNYRLDSMTIRMQLLEGSGIIEQWTGDLAPGQSETFITNSAIRFSEEEDIPYICVDLLPPLGRIDVDTTNNRICKAIVESDLAIWSVPEPNPTSGRLSIRLLNAKRGTMSITLADETGRTLLAEERRVGEELVETLTFDLSSSASGQYYIRLEQGTRVRTFPILLLVE